MARKRRCIQAGFCYHVMLRGNGGQDLFRDKSDRARFYLLLQYASEIHHFRIHGFCLMSNHVHLVIQPTNTNLSAGMHALGFRYAQYFNKKYRRRGYLYQGRYKAVIVQSGTYLRRLVRYIHLNPVRACISQSPDQYPWSSYRSCIGKDKYTWLHCDLVLEAFGGINEIGIEQMYKYTAADDDEARKEADEIRKSLRRGAYGDDVFIEKWCPTQSDDKWTEKSNLDYVDKINLEDIVDAVCSHLDLTLEDVRSHNRSKKLVQARTIMADLTKKVGAGTMTDLGKHISRDPTSLAKLAKKGGERADLQYDIDELLNSLSENSA